MKISNLKSFLLIVVIAFSFQSHAQLVFKTAFIGKNATTECYKLYVLALKSDPKFSTIFASEAEAVHQKSDCKMEKSTASLGNNTKCPAFILNGITLTTGKDAPKCLQEYVNDVTTKEALQAAIDVSLGRLKGFKGAKTSTPQGLLVYPIPAHNYLNIATGFKDIRSALLIMTDVSGKNVFQIQLQNPSTDAYTLCLKEFKAGTYFITITAENKEIAKQTILVQ